MSLKFIAFEKADSFAALRNDNPIESINPT